MRVDELLKRCTVKLLVPEVRMVGTGFFVAPGLILTCYHVVKDAATATVAYADSLDYATATVEQTFPESDIALLSLDPPDEDLPCVLLGTDEPEATTQVSAFGYPDRFNEDGTPWQGIPLLLTVEGTTGDRPPFLQLTLGNVLPGMSGAPILDRATGRVCAMVKFTRDEDPLLGGGGILASTVADCLPEVVAAQAEYHRRDRRWSEARPLQPIVENLPKNKSQTFRGRESELARLQRQMAETGTVAITSILGMGGVGKTELALQYADRYRDSYPGGICWLPVRDANPSVELLRYSQGHLGLTLPEEQDLPQQLAHCWRHWPGEDEVLLVYDDVTDYRKIEAVLPPRQSRRFRTLLTTRQRNLATTVQDFPLETLKPEAALELLTALTGAERVSAEADTARALCDYVGYLPLGLELLGNFLKEKPDLTLARLLERLQKNRVKAKAFKAAHPGMTAKLGIVDAFDLSWQELGEEARQLACRLSLYALAPIPWGLVEAAVSEEEREDIADARDDELLKLSLVQRLEPGVYQLHQLVREFCLARLSERSDADDLKRAYCDAMVQLAQAMPQSPTQELIQNLSPVVPHMEEATARWQGFLADENQALLWPYVFLARFYEGQGFYAQAEPWYAACLNATRQRFGNEHPDVASSLNNLAGLYRAQGRYEQAEPLYVESLELRKRLLGEEHPDVASSLNNLAGLCESQGRYEQAEPLYVESLELMKRLLGEEHPSVASSLNNLAFL